MIRLGRRQPPGRRGAGLRKGPQAGVDWGWHNSGSSLRSPVVKRFLGLEGGAWACLLGSGCRLPGGLESLTTQCHFGRDANKRETKSPLQGTMGRQRGKVICYEDLFFPLCPKIGLEFSREAMEILGQVTFQRVLKKTFVNFSCLSSNPPASFQTLLPLTS